MDNFSGPGVSASAVENVYDSANDLVGSMTWSAASSGSTWGIIDLTEAYQSLHVVLTVNKSISSAGSAASSVSMSILGQYYQETPVAQLGSISSSVFCDENGSGVQTPNDFGLSGVTVELLNSTGTQVLETTTTDANGNYSFTDLQPGTYETEVIAPNGDTITTSNGGVDSGIVVNGGQNTPTAATGLDMPAVFNVNVYFDANDNGVYDTGDSQLPGVTVDLLNSSAADHPDGDHGRQRQRQLHRPLPGDTYEVSVVTPTGDVVTRAINVRQPNAVISCGTESAVEGLYVTSTGGGSPTPDVSIVKSVASVGGVAGDNTATYLGESIDYSVVVSNTGNETLTNVVVTDPTLGGVTLGTLATLAVGGSATFSASTTVTQAELDSAPGQVTNTAVVTDDQTPSMSSTVSTPVSASPGVSIVKSVASVGGVAGDNTATYLGESIDYSVVVSNTGNETLTNVVVTDPTLGGVTLGTLATLAVGGSATFSASTTVTQAELDSAPGQVTNTAVVTDTQTPSMSSTVSTPVSATPGVSIVKSVTSVGGVAGDRHRDLRRRDRRLQRRGRATPATRR